MVTWGWGSQVGKLRQEVIKKNLDLGHTNGRWQSRPAAAWVNHSDPPSSAGHTAAGFW